MYVDPETTTGHGARVVDFHNHVIPGVDDGARDETDTRDALAAMFADGVRVLIASPHVDASIALRQDRMDERMGELDTGWARLLEIAQAVPGMDVRRGAEVKLDTPEPDLADERFRLAGGRFVLFEFPYFTVPPRSARAFTTVRAQGWIPIVAHPERYPGIRSDPDVVTAWREAGAYLQVNGPSLTGRYGEEARAAGLMMLENGWVDYLASDYHARGRPDISAYRQALLDADGEEQMTLLTETNPARLLRDEAPLPVPPLAGRRSLWERIAAPFR
jgi:protein-tyrosine phosphatase